MSWIFQLFAANSRLFNEKDHKIRPGRFVCGRSTYFRTALGLTIAFITSNRTLPHTGVFQSIISFSRRLTKPCTIFPLSLTHRLNCVGT